MVETMILITRQMSPHKRTTEYQHNELLYEQNDFLWVSNMLKIKSI